MTAVRYRAGDQVRVLSTSWPGIWTVREVHAATVQLVQNGSEHGTITLTAYLTFVEPAEHGVHPD